LRESEFESENEYFLGDGFLGIFLEKHHIQIIQAELFCYLLEGSQNS